MSPMQFEGIAVEAYLPSNPTIKDRLIFLVIKRKMTVQDLVRKSGLNYQTVRNYLYKDHIPSLTNAAKLAQALDVSLDWLGGLKGSKFEEGI